MAPGRVFKAKIARTLIWSIVNKLLQLDIWVNWATQWANWETHITLIRELPVINSMLIPKVPTSSTTICLVHDNRISYYDNIAVTLICEDHQSRHRSHSASMWRRDNILLGHYRAPCSQCMVIPVRYASRRGRVSGLSHEQIHHLKHPKVCCRYNWRPRPIYPGHIWVDTVTTQHCSNEWYIANAATQPCRQQPL